jgi:uncharacterized protein YjbJ (UPF0337 family)
MDENRIEGAANEGAGRLQDAWGGLTGDSASAASEPGNGWTRRSG